MTETFVKHSSDKPRPALFPPMALESIAAVLAFGAKKYTRRIDVHSEELKLLLRGACTCENITKQRCAILIDDMQLGDCVFSATRQPIPKLVAPSAIRKDLSSTSQTLNANPATIGDSKLQIPITPNGNEKIQQDGSPTTKRIDENTHTITPELLTPKSESSFIDGGSNLESLDSHRKMSSESSAHRTVAAPSVVDHPEEVASSTSTMITPLTHSADSSATAAIKDSVCSEILSKVLHAHSTTCAVSRFRAERCTLVVPGEGNWKNAPVWSVYGDAVLRHFFAFLHGEDTDPESGLPHLSHCACSLLFLLEFQLRKWSVDDRLSAPKEKP